MYNIDDDHESWFNRQGLFVPNPSAGDPKVVQIESTYPGISVDLPATVGSTFRAVDGSHPTMFFIKADLVCDELTFNVITVDPLNSANRSTIRATQFFAAALDWFGAGNVMAIKSTWVDTPGFNTNFLAFQGVYDPNTDNREEAVRATPSYKIVSKPQFGFSNIITAILSPSRKTFNLVEVEFSR